MLFFAVDLVAFLAVVLSYFCFFGPVLEASDILSDARLFGADTGAAADAGTARDDRRGMGRLDLRTVWFVFSYEFRKCPGRITGR